MEFKGTTICAVKKDGVTVIAGDGQVTMGESVVFKANAVKVKRIYGGKVVVGFAGSVSDAFSLSEKFEKMLQKFSGNLMRSAVELAELWRNDKMPRQLQAMLIAADKDNLLVLSGTGEVIDPDSGVCAIGSGGLISSAKYSRYVQTTATVVKLERNTRISDDDSNWEVTIRYKAGDKNYQRSYETDSKYNTGDSIVVKYNPDNPLDLVRGKENGAHTLVLFGLAMSVACLLYSMYFSAKEE